MKNSLSFPVFFLGALLLMGCNDSNDDETQASAAVYTGATQDENGNPVEAQVIVEPLQASVLTLWDDRDHQMNYAGKQMTADKVSFSAAQYQCKLNGDKLNCDTPMGEFLLDKQPLVSQSLKDYIGSYQALWDGSLYQIAVESEGLVELTGNNCRSEGQLKLSEYIDGLVELKIIEGDCGLENFHAYTQLTIENDSLYSLNMMTTLTSFPTTWVRQG